MAVEIEETFEVDAPIERVWRFLTEPQAVVTCMPGAELQEVVDERTFQGRIKVKVGAIATSYQGRVQLTEIDEQAHRVTMSAEGQESAGGVARGSMVSQLRAGDQGRTEVTAAGRVEISGRMAQFGRGMVKGVAHELVKQFVACLKERLEGEPQGQEGEAMAPPGERSPVATKPIGLFTVAFRALLSGLSRFIRRVLRLGRRTPQ